MRSKFTLIFWLISSAQCSILPPSGMDIDSEISAIENLAIEGPENSLEVPAIGGLSTSRLGEECAAPPGVCRSYEELECNFHTRDQRLKGFGDSLVPTGPRSSKLTGKNKESVSLFLSELNQISKRLKWLEKRHKEFWKDTTKKKSIETWSALENCCKDLAQFRHVLVCRNLKRCLPVPTFLWNTSIDVEDKGSKEETPRLPQELSELVKDEGWKSIGRDYLLTLRGLIIQYDISQVDRYWEWKSTCYSTALQMIDILNRNKLIRPVDYQTLFSNQEVLNSLGTFIIDSYVFRNQDGKMSYYKPVATFDLVFESLEWIYLLNPVKAMSKKNSGKMVYSMLSESIRQYMLQGRNISELKDLQEIVFNPNFIQRLEGVSDFGEVEGDSRKLMGLISNLPLKYGENLVSMEGLVQLCYCSIEFIREYIHPNIIEKISSSKAELNLFRNQLEFFELGLKFQIIPYFSKVYARFLHEKVGIPKEEKIHLHNIFLERYEKLHEHMVSNFKTEKMNSEEMKTWTKNQRILKDCFDERNHNSAAVFRISAYFIFSVDS